jgi:hypothetical protein
MRHALDRKGPNLNIFTDSVWQMSFGERSALEGVLTQLRPKVSIEIGTAEGGSLERVAAHSEVVHSFDLVTPSLPVAETDRVVLHTGDSHALLPTLLADLTKQQTNVDFVLVDGDHSADGVRRDIEDLLDSPAVGRTHILIHDINNERVREGLDAVNYDAWKKVALVELDFVPGYMFREEALRHELWGGLGLVVVDVENGRPGANGAVQRRYYTAASLFQEARDLVVAREISAAAGVDAPDASEPELEPSRREQRLAARIEALEGELLRVGSVAAHHQALWESMMESASWKATSPLRAAAALARRLTAR